MATDTRYAQMRGTCLDVLAALRLPRTCGTDEFTDAVSRCTRSKVRLVLAENVVLAGQAACWYSWMTPRTRSCRRTRKPLRSVTSGGSGLSGAALDRAM